MKSMRRGSGLVLGLLWLLMADLATAGDYMMMVGKGFEVCEAYLKNLNSFPNHPPMVCDRPLNPKLKEFSKPAWQQVDILQNFDLLGKIEQTLRGMTDEQWNQQSEQWEMKVRERVASGWLGMSTTGVDVDRDGNGEQVLRYVNDPGGCDPKNQATYSTPSGSKLFALTPDHRGLDVWKSGNFNHIGGRPELFLFKDQVYLTTWAGGPNFRGGELWVLTPNHVPGMDKQTCKFTYKLSSQRRHQ
ncbi:MAG: hypothetical protein E8D46_10700 [Nitrospira sp.]|nr:MAG: hypothetical protein E8D46_10700 [Nitrospira sp.]